MRDSLNKDIYGWSNRILKSRYRLVEFISEGGMGIVYRGKDVNSGEKVAVKILPPRFLVTNEKAEVYLRLFNREAEILRTLNHRNIVRLYDSGIDGDMVFFVMEWLDGRPLGEELTQKGRMSCQRASEILAQISDALETAHTQKIIHLDLKPNNIFIVNPGAPNEIVKIIDFGLSRILQSTVGSTLSRLIGTPQYMAPEVFENRANFLSDIYSVGVLTFEMLSGVLPFSNTQIYALVRQHLWQEPPSIRKYNKEVTEYIQDLIRRTMSKTPSERPQGALEFYREFKMGTQVFVVDGNYGAQADQRSTIINSPSFEYLVLLVYFVFSSAVGIFSSYLIIHSFIANKYSFNSIQISDCVLYLCGASLASILLRHVSDREFYFRNPYPLIAKIILVIEITLFFPALLLLIPGYIIVRAGIEKTLDLRTDLRRWRLKRKGWKLRRRGVGSPARRRDKWPFE